MPGRIVTSILQVLLALCLLVTPNIPTQATETLIFGAYAFEKPTTTVRKLRPILNALETELSKQTGRTIKIRMRVASTYRGAIRDIIKGRVDFGRYGQAAYVFVKSANQHIKIIAVEGDHKKKTFRSVIVVQKNSDIQTLQDLKGRSFAFGNEYSTTGRYFPQAYLTQHGITADQLSKFVYLGRHDRVAWAITDGTFDAGAISEWVYQDLVRQKATIRVIASFSNVTKPWVARKGLSPKLLRALQKSLLALQGIKALGRIKKDCFLPGHDTDYTSARLVIANNWEFFTTSPSSNNRQ